MKRAVIALIQSGDEVLMGKRADSGKFTAPGGCVEFKEDPSDALIREVKEETGLVVDDYKMVDVMMGRDALVYLYSVKVKGKIDISNDPDEEFTEMAWIDPFKVELHYPAEDNIVTKYLSKK